MPSSKTPIKYTNREFDTIKQDLVQYARRYYPEVYRDFNEASFGSLMLDTVSYIGDVLSFYIDYQVNESFLDSAAEFSNVVRLSKQLGYKYRGTSSSTGVCYPVERCRPRPKYFVYANSKKRLHDWFNRRQQLYIGRGCIFQ